MGCGGSRDKEKGVHAPLDHWMATIGVESIDQTFTDSVKTIESAEELRAIIIDNRDALVISSGACSVPEPTIMDCFKGVCWKLSADNDGKFLDAGFTMSEGDFKLEGKKNSAEGKQAYEELEAYVKSLASMQMQEKLENLGKVGKEMATQFVEKAPEMMTQLTDSFKDKPLQLPWKLKDLKSNIEKCVNAAACIALLVKEMTNFLSCFKTLSEFFSEVAKIDEVGLKAHKAKQVKAYEIVWNYITDPKMKYGKKADDGLQLWMRRRDVKKATKEAHAKKK